MSRLFEDVEAVEAFFRFREADGADVVSSPGVGDGDDPHKTLLLSRARVPRQTAFGSRNAKRLWSHG